MAVLDSYSSANQDNVGNVGGNDPGNSIYAGWAQSFASGAGGTLDLAKFFLSKVGTPTGNATAKIYAHSGTFGTDSKPTGAALATSDNFDVSTLTGALALISFIFSGANRISLTPGTNYELALEYSGGDSANFLNIGFDESTPTHPGNMAILITGAWTENFRDLVFSLEAIEPSSLNTAPAPALMAM